MKKTSPSINEIVSYGLDQIDTNKTVEVNLRDLLYIYKAFEEFNRYFHQPLHFKTISDLEKYLGDRDEGAFSVIGYIYHDIFRRMLTEEVQKVIDSDDFAHPEYPEYYKS